GRRAGLVFSLPAARLLPSSPAPGWESFDVYTFSLPDGRRAPGAPPRHPFRVAVGGRIMSKVSTETQAENGAEETPRTSANFWSLTLGSVGVVYGDIGTSPLYAFREAASAAGGGGPIGREIVLGVLSLIVWALVIVVTVK